MPFISRIDVESSFTALHATSIVRSEQHEGATVLLATYAKIHRKSETIKMSVEVLTPGDAWATRFDATSAIDRGAAAEKMQAMLDGRVDLKRRAEFLRLIEMVAGLG